MLLPMIAIHLPGGNQALSETVNNLIAVVVLRLRLLNMKYCAIPVRFWETRVEYKYAILRNLPGMRQMNISFPLRSTPI
jgi:hypothetical protein